MGWIIRNNELTEEEFNSNVSFPSQPLAPALWRVDEQLHTGLQNEVEFPSYPLAPALWRVTERGLETGFFHRSPDDNEYWVISGGELKNKNAPDPIYLGAFANEPTLISVTIPKTVKQIGRYAFYNTGINHVTIASDCHYYATSFPSGTIVDFYEESEGENNG